MPPSTSCSILRSLAPFLHAREELLDACTVLLGAIEVEDQVRSVSQAQAVGNLVAYVALCAFESAQGLFDLLLLADNRDEYLRRAAIRREMHFAGGSKTDARVGEFSFEDGADLIADSVGQAFHVVLAPAILDHND